MDNSAQDQSQSQEGAPQTYTQQEHITQNYAYQGQPAPQIYVPQEQQPPQSYPYQGTPATQTYVQQSPAPQIYVQQSPAPQTYAPQTYAPQEQAEYPTHVSQEPQGPQFYHSEPKTDGIRVNTTALPTDPENPESQEAEAAASTGPKAYRTNEYFWGLRILQVIFAVTILAVCASDISSWTSIGCSTPAGLDFNMAVGVIALVPILYIVFSTGVKPCIPTKYKVPFYTILGLDILLVILFIIAASLTNYSCTYVCSLCANGPGAYDQGYGYYVQINDLSCDCYFATDTIGFLKRSEVTVRSDSPGVLFDRSTSRRLGATVNKGITRATKQGLDSAMIVLLVTGIVTLFLLKRYRTVAQNVDGTAATIDKVINRAVDNVDMNNVDLSVECVVDNAMKGA